MTTNSVSLTSSLSLHALEVGLDETRYAMPSYVFPKHQALNLNATVSANSAMKKITMHGIEGSYHFANIIFLRVLASLRPLRGCNCARPLHDMSKYFNPFFLNTLAVHSPIAF
jgi:hypothetical protein